MSLYYQDEFVTLYHGDCLSDHHEWLSADVLATDPPYGVAYKSGWDNQFKHVSIANDETLDARDSVVRGWGKVKPAIVFGTWKVRRPDGVKAVLIWDKGTVGMGDLAIPWFPATEEIYIINKGWQGSRTSPVLRHHVRNSFHPTQKPLSLMQTLIAKSVGETVADPFAGSGSTLLAARNLGRKAIGVELEERYCEVIAQRCAQEVLNFGVVS